MDKKLSDYEKLIIAKIDKFEHDLKIAKGEKEISQINVDIQNLIKYHQSAIRNFQHERFIHLMVTFFFGCLLLTAITAVFLLPMMPVDNNYLLLNNLNIVICGLLFVIEIFYVRHYYRLENGTQKLYPLSKKLYELTTK